MIALLSAMPDEIDLTLGTLATGPARIERRGEREYHRVELCGRECVVAYSRCGKVAAAVATTELVSTFGASAVIFMGVAGALGHGVRRGDVVIGTNLLQHDLDASPIFPQFEIPLTGRTWIQTDEALRERIAAAAHRVRLADSGAAWRVHEGAIISGDRFVASRADAMELARRIPGALCVEMEGAAAAQVCAEYGVPFGVMRVISDGADESAAADFAGLLREASGRLRDVASGVLGAIVGAA